MFAYPDAARHRLGVNYQFLPTNAPKGPPVYCPTERDGAMNFTANYGGDPNYVGTKLKPVRFQLSNAGVWSEQGREEEKKEEPPHAQYLDARPIAFSSETTPEDFFQATALWKIISKQDGGAAGTRFVENVAAHAAEVTHQWLREEVYGMFYVLYHFHFPPIGPNLQSFGPFQTIPSSLSASAGEM